jgi:MFS family permease
MRHANGVPGPDARLIYVAAFLRAATVGAVGVILAIFLGQSGHSLSTTGVLIGVGLTGATLITAAAGAVADRLGRRRTLAAIAALMAGGYLGLALVHEMAWLLPIAFFGMLNGMGRDRGPAGALEQAMLPETTDAGGRTWVLAWYNVSLDAAHASGALAGATPALLAAAVGVGTDTAHRITLGLCAALVAASAVPYLLLSRRVEVPPSHPETPAPPVAPETRGAVRRLAVLFGIDSLGGGFLSSALVGYWFLHTFALSEQQLAVLFFAARVLNALSHVGAAWLARRIGLLNTMVFTHLPSSFLLMSVPVAPSALMAVALFLCREGLVEMDVPTRQSYVMAIVPPQDRTYASAVTNLTRTAGWAAGPAVAGFVMQHVVMAGPLLLGGLLKIGYDVALYTRFRHLKPPEEAGETGVRHTGGGRQAPG